MAMRDKVKIKTSSTYRELANREKKEKQGVCLISKRDIKFIKNDFCCW